MTVLDQFAVKIDKKVPIPSKKMGYGRNRIYPWLEMEVGDSFLFPKGNAPGSCYRSTYIASKTYGGRKFAAKKTMKGIRCWRIA